jgi:TM2 domain-containing membrane protein YozV
MGIGHFYVGRIARGIAILIAGLIMDIAFFFFLSFGMVAAFFGGGGLLGLAILIGLITVVLWVWQIYDAYTLAKKFNKAVDRTGKAP